jgi:hypothetical protein
MGLAGSEAVVMTVILGLNYIKPWYAYIESRAPTLDRVSSSR